MREDTTKPKPIRVGGKIVAVQRGAVLDIRRRCDGILRDPPAIAISQEVLHEARKANLIRCINLDTNATYTISRTDFDKWSYRRQNTVEPYEMQRACSVTHWAYCPAEGVNIPFPVETVATPVYQQVNLFAWGERDNECINL